MASPLPIKDISQAVSRFWREAKSPRSGIAACTALVMSSGIIALYGREHEKEKTKRLYKSEEEKTKRAKYWHGIYANSGADVANEEKGSRKP